MWEQVRENFQNRLKKYPFPLQISEEIKIFSQKGCAFGLSQWELVEGQIFFAIWVSKTLLPLQISEGQKIFFRNPDKWVSKTAPFVQMSEGIIFSSSRVCKSGL